MNLPFYIAGRYLFAKKSHNVINIISAISAAGMALGTAALIVILSIYNGFDRLVAGTLSDADPDLLVQPVQGKYFEPDSAAFAWAYDNPCVHTMNGVLQERVFATYDGRQTVVTAKGIDPDQEIDTPLRSHTIAGEFRLTTNDIDHCVLGSLVASNLGVNVRFPTPLKLYFPQREGSISMANPTANLLSAVTMPSGIVSVTADIDSKLLIVPIRTMQKLLGVGTEVSAVEIRFAPGTAERQKKSVKDELQQRLGQEYKVLNRYQQNESVYRMMKYEKAMTYLILLFVIIIIAFNIFGSLSMLIIEKKEDISTLYAMGATPHMVRRIFVLEGWLISLLGLAIGLVVGLLVAWLQQRFGFVPMPGNYIVSSYPVAIEFLDVLFTAAGVAAVGYIVALLPVLGHSQYK